MRRYSIGFVAAIVLAVVLGGAKGYTQSPSAAARAHLAAAKKAAGYDNATIYDHTCSRLLVGASLPYGRIPPPDNDRDPAKFHTEPVKVFDNLYYVGEKMQHGASPSSWAVVTSAGIILIDTLFENSVQDQIVGGLRKMNLDPANIKNIILSHGHADHVGGAKYLQDAFKPRIFLGAADWDAMEQNKNFRGPKPTRDVATVNGQKLTLGDETITMYITPGHTPGGMSLLIPVKDGGTPHLAALWGGTGFQFSAEEYSKSAFRFREIATKAGADVMLSTHPQLDLSDIKLPLVLKRKPGDPNPYVVGNEVVKGYLTVAGECAAAAVLMPDEYKAYLGR